MSFFTHQSHPFEGLAYRGSADFHAFPLMQTLAQFRQRCVGLLQNQLTQPLQLRAAENRGKSASTWFGGNRIRFTPPLQQPSNKRRADVEAFGRFLAGFQIFIAGLNDPRPQIQGTGIHANLRIRSTSFYPSLEIPLH
jgi:hypothetical protein